ncbi:MAG: antibiotic biosynthesis monooxygenase [Chakrabartia sp.]
MIAIIFEVWPADGEMQHYLDLAAALKADLEKIDGFISIERFQSLNEANKLLSLSFFRDEAAVEQWRNRPGHRATQTKGRSGVFSNYRLRVALVIRDYGLHDRTEAPQDSLAAHN